MSGLLHTPPLQVRPHEIEFAPQEAREAFRFPLRRAPNPLRLLPERLDPRLPIYLYRFRLGWLLGHRVLLLIHQGRKSRRVRRTPLEVIRYDPATEESVVVSAWGDKADWYRNLKANPAKEIRTGRERYVPEQRFLAPEEVYAEIAAYERHHPWLARTIPRWLGHPLDGTENARGRFANSVRMVAFRPENGTPQPERDSRCPRECSV